MADSFAVAGLDVSSPNDITVTISGTKAQFEAVFGVQLVVGGEGAYTVEPPPGPVDEGTETWPREQVAALTELPLTRLPSRIQRLVSVITLEVPVTPDDASKPTA